MIVNNAAAIVNEKVSKTADKQIILIDKLRRRRRRRKRRKRRQMS
jgi:hypothetical protein